ncbi:class I SAM-dependent methyltransferase [Paenibacillus dokdonensis]|uniref:class I SAM-dependent methyltransferase n=1 Tax=Paenibacillus dokdonensis TaxID=2567944 RepID=UPI0010A88B3E|nr:class I SAM-dependent methyltransferase [Paenibacillus dokdonensis]
MTNDIIHFIVDCMAAGKEMSDIQKIQTAHRIMLADFWGIHEGAKVLEIGCGQGDTTAVLAYFAGESGFVHGIDIGPPDYGAPITLGDSAKHLMQSALGKRIQMEFEVDVLSPDIDFPEHSFDFVVFSHCSWYLRSSDELMDILRRVKNWGRQLCFAEWDTRIERIEQYPHLLSILIQAQYEAFKRVSDSNVRTLFTSSDIQHCVRQAGWTTLKEQSLMAGDLQDGEWEVKKVLLDAEVELELGALHHMPAKNKDLIRSQIMMLKQSIEMHPIKPLSVYTFTAI